MKNSQKKYNVRMMIGVGSLFLVVIMFNPPIHIDSEIVATPTPFGKHIFHKLGQQLTEICTEGLSPNQLPRDMSCKKDLGYAIISSIQLHRYMYIHIQL